MSVKIYHNPSCSKSRATLQLLDDNGVTPDVTEYLTNPPSSDELSEILQMLGLEPRQLMRTNDAEYTEQNLADPEFSREALIQAMVDYPKLMERPIVVNGNKAAIGRPPEHILDIL